MYKFNLELRSSKLADLEVDGLQRTSSIIKDARKNVALYAGLLGMRLDYKSMNFEDPSIYHLAYAASSTGCEEGPTQEELVAVRRFGRRVAEKAAQLVGGRAHV
jgi:catechol 2,3-dioxygenase-like lactoylglutathione lyase family enzyme